MKRFVLSWSAFFGSIRLSNQVSLGNCVCSCFDWSLVYLRFHAPWARCSNGSVVRQGFALVVVVASDATKTDDVAHPAAIGQQFQAPISIAHLAEDSDPYFQPKFDYCSFRYHHRMHGQHFVDLLAKILANILANLRAVKSPWCLFSSPFLVKPPHSASSAACTCRTGLLFQSFVWTRCQGSDDPQELGSCFDRFRSRVQLQTPYDWREESSKSHQPYLTAEKCYRNCLGLSH